MFEETLMVVLFEETLMVVLSLAEIEPIEALPEALDDLFRRLSEQSVAAEASFIEDDIWETWTAHPDPAAGALMSEAIAAIAGKRFERAQSLLDDLVRAQPLWPEAWNKRATLAFLRGLDEASARDIRRTLQMEPRHFGALAGFTQICLRNGETRAALEAAEAALRIHPHLLPMRRIAEELRRLHPPRLH
jgi:tetratricopeptide (TPR) repeat protein